MNRDLDEIRRAFAAAGLAAGEGDESGGSILFFSGGSALKEVARSLAALTSRTTHIVTTFDSGGSTAEIRRAFRTPAFGDLRLRLSSLSVMSDRSGRAFFERRLGADGAAELDSVIGGAGGPDAAFAALLDFFRRVMPPDFDLRGAALGNLILAADYLKTGRSLHDTVARLAAALGAAGRVLPVSEDPVHLAVRLESGEILAGQHRFTGKSGAEPASPIRKMFFCRGLDDLSPAVVRPAPGVLEAVESSDLICYPVGSFYSSVLANLLVEGVGGAVLRSRARKVYMPNPGRDPESAHLSLEERMRALCRAVSGGASEDPRGVIDFLLVDGRAGRYRGGVPLAWCAARGVRVIDCAYVEKGGPVLPERSALLLRALSGARLLA